MADIVATQRNRIQSGVLGDKDTTSCSGTPGGGTLDSAYIYVNTYINTALDSDGYLWFANTSGYVRQTGMVDGVGTRYWFSSCMVDKDPFNITYGGSYGTFNDLYAGKYHQVELWKSIGVDLSFTGNTTYNVTTSPATTAAAQNAGYWNSGYTIDDCDPTTSEGIATIDLYVAYPVFRTTDSSGNTGGTSDTPTSFNAVKFSFDVTEATYRGKLFIYTIAQALRMSMLCTARKMSELNPSLKMPEESLRKLLGQLRSVQARKHRTTDAFIVGAVAKRHRDLLDLLGIEKLPGYLNR